MCVVAVVVSFLLLNVMVYVGGFLIKCSILSSFVLYVVAGVAFLRISTLVACIFWFLAAIQLCWYYCVRRRIPFAGMLESA
jgi:hypothetical protein